MRHAPAAADPTPRAQARSSAEGMISVLGLSLSRCPSGRSPPATDLRQEAPHWRDHHVGEARPTKLATGPLERFAFENGGFTETRVGSGSVAELVRQ